jgi:hypothetical protein
MGDSLCKVQPHIYPNENPQPFVNVQFVNSLKQGRKISMPFQPTGHKHRPASAAAHPHEYGRATKTCNQKGGREQQRSVCAITCLT